MKIVFLVQPETLPGKETNYSHPFTLGILPGSLFGQLHRFHRRIPGPAGMDRLEAPKLPFKVGGHLLCRATQGNTARETRPRNLEEGFGDLGHPRKVRDNGYAPTRRGQKTRSDRECVAS